MPELILKPGREKSVLKHHPWIFSGAIASINGTPALGQTVKVITSSGEPLAQAAYNHNSSIAGRIWTWDINEHIDRKFFVSKINRSIDIRRNLGSLVSSNALRLVHAESDGLPGLILDRFKDICVVQFLSAGTEYYKDDILQSILESTGVSKIYERSDVDVRQLEGMVNSNGLRVGESLVTPVEILENEMKFLVDIVEGHKTGFYLDQRDNRFLARNIAKERNVLDCFSYTGGFAVNCLAGGARSVTVVESSEPAKDLARKNILLNKLNMERVSFIEQDVFKYLRTLRDKGDTYDLIILDPPKFAATASQAERAARGYKDINLLAFKLLNKNGYLLTFSCSGGVSEDLFEKIVSGAAQDADADAVILKRLHQAADHPVALNFPEGAYLKGFLIEKLN
jgi:23S rRNA (cytosine1962-C5)-methyltransferase